MILSGTSKPACRWSLTVPVPGIDRVGGSESAPATTRKNDAPIA